MTLEEFRQQTKLLPPTTELFLKSPRDAYAKAIADLLWEPRENALTIVGKKAGEAK